MRVPLSLLLCVTLQYQDTTESIEYYEVQKVKVIRTYTEATLVPLV